MGPRLKVWQPKQEPYEEPRKVEPAQPMRYHAIADPLFRGTWRAEPLNYRGRGIVYLFHGYGARARAIEWAARKNEGRKNEIDQLGNGAG